MDSENTNYKPYIYNSNKQPLITYNQFAQTAIIASPLFSWPIKAALIDLICSLSHSKYSLTLERFIQIDIDDGFVGAVSTRTNPDDVKAVINFQNKWKQKIHGFVFMVGFSGKFYQNSNITSENEGDASWLQNSNKFLWFDHMWSHMQPHWWDNKKELCDYMRKGKFFAYRQKLKVNHGYAVAPHHSGVYPIHEPLYECWRELYDISVTSTEEYPHLKHAYFRRGFKHNNINVLPRQTCGIFTKTFKYKDFPGGKQRFEEIIHGGELFQTILLNRFNIFMTHLQNYGNDRLSLRLFDKFFSYLFQHTNIRLRQVNPKDLAKKYFDMFPNEKDVVFNNPCDDKRHLEIMATNPKNRREIFDPKSYELSTINNNKNTLQLPVCFNLPDIIIIGPQKTGTTAFTFFLEMHPLFVGNKQLPDTYEEVQFFNRDERYFQGPEWYNQWFVNDDREKFDRDRFVGFSAGNAVRNVRERKRFIFEKSANYFTSPYPTIQTRINNLLPRAVLVAVLLEPGKRAYSWYQHQRAHNDPTAMKYSFEEVIRAENSIDKKLVSLRSHCLFAGLYLKHLKNWTSKTSLILIDGELLKSRPDLVMNEFVETVKNTFVSKAHTRSNKKISPSIYSHQSTRSFNFTENLYFDKTKKFFCKKSAIQNKDILDSFPKNHKCLGSGKGRNYSDMSVIARAFLDEYYSSANKELKEWLIYTKQRVPVWLS